ncbi:hypothetical protein [Blastococcus sp. VKM Ac-2987]|uniref:hypothetical protein n=1 Tax=Blastococcus sp. VKM Ac-2987 TaxID=3004141 RepID=UPI0022ABB3B6|nr:hypothetical protein [Blastococcus sp. VKM Ac-2987]MCZ2857817.1 hypothetical protein [Blastococcus sp. VKM Ac-2987]
MTCPSLSVDDMRFAYRLLLTVGPREIDTALELIADAPTAHDGHHPADLDPPL